MKTCARCKESKELTCYRFRKASKDGLESTCKDCRRAYDNKSYRDDPSRRESIKAQTKERSIRLKRFVREYLESHPCVDCGQTDADLLEFDHVRGTKSNGISNMIAGACSMERLQAEIDKCEVRCLYCHRKRTIQQLGWYNWLTEEV